MCEKRTCLANHGLNDCSDTDVGDGLKAERPQHGGTWLRPFFPNVSSLAEPFLNGKGFTTTPIPIAPGGPNRNPPRGGQLFYQDSADGQNPY